MELFFPRQRGGAHSVLGKWTPSTAGGRVAYNGWAGVGALVVALLYPLVLVGFALRYYTRRIDRAAASLGLLGVVGLSAVVWGGLTIVAHLQFSRRGFIAVAAAAVVATVAAGAAVGFARAGGRGTTIVFAYPSAMTALFLPPVVAALFSVTLGSVILPGSTELAVRLLDGPLATAGASEFLRENYTLEGAAYVGMWFAIAVPVGWVFGCVVTLANLVRPTR
ncbi:hypothetical protein C497_09323 [Halalkalicoccus jeotgali B3]|uniref:Uncharacterized protein n=2 Tax=Halalkalicoccus jeotgali TaxID=413810 RepID=D8J8F6_HALJB|nr:hypothetical protein [Halalkalicoccus jeotgali]ADJ16202.1 hypothetical protein HacjB3_14105 [Halalkalicoccus jeotgali B3]ELY37630.1 hypothetical protein C497_09323 [Halalkalicoccus jeotgali B3]